MGKQKKTHCLLTVPMSHLVVLVNLSILGGVIPTDQIRKTGSSDAAVHIDLGFHDYK